MDIANKKGAVAEPDKIVKVQHDLLSKVSKTLRNYKKDPIDRHTKTYFEICRNNLEKIYTNFQLNHKSLVNSKLDLNDKYFTGDVRIYLKRILQKLTMVLAKRQIKQTLFGFQGFCQLHFLVNT